MSRQVVFAFGEKPLRADKLNQALDEVYVEGGGPIAITIIGQTLGRRLDEFGTVDRTGTSNMAPLINDAIAACAAAGDPLVIGPGNYLNSGEIRLVDNAHVHLSETATLIRAFSTTGARGHICQANIAAPISNVRWHGGRLYNAAPNTYRGNAFGLWLDDSEISGVFVDNWEGRAINLYGKRNRIHDGRLVSPLSPGGGGIRLDGCEGTIVENMHVRCDDDCFMFSQNGNAASAYNGLTTRSCQYVNCYGESYSARVAVSILERTGIEDLISGGLEYNAFIGVEGKGGAAVGNTLSTTAVHRTIFIGCRFDISDRGPTTSNQGAIDIDAGDGLRGGVTDIEFHGCHVISPNRPAVSILGVAKNIRFFGGLLDASRGDNQTIKTSGSTTAQFIGVTIRGRADRDIAQIGLDNAGTSRVDFIDCVFENIGNTGAPRYGVNYTSLAGGRLRGNRFIEASGATTARAFIVGANVSNLAVEDNDYTGLSTTTKTIWSPTNGSNCTLRSRPRTIVTGSTRAIDEEESGWVFCQTASGARNFTLPAAAEGLSYTFTQTGSGAVSIVAAAGDTIRIPGSVSTSGGSITSGAAGDHVVLVAVNDAAWLAVSIGGTWTAA